MKNQLYLIDGSAYIYRAYHAIAPLSNSRGTATHAILGFVNMVNRLLRERKPEYMAIAFDSKGEVFRHQLYRDYKANRPTMPADLQEQIPYIKQFVEATNIMMLETPGVEADDIIASVVDFFTSPENEVVVVSGDKDLLQLAGDSVTIYDPMKEKVIDAEGVMDKYGVSVAQLLDYFALVGDSSDNIPGVPGVGPKTAQKLIQGHGSLDGLYDNVAGLKKSKMKEKIIANKEQAYLSKTLIDLKRDVEIPKDLTAYHVVEPDQEKLYNLYAELEFTNLLKGVDLSTRIDTSGFVSVRSEDQLQGLKEELDQADILVIDTETTSLVARKARLVGISLCTTLEKAYYLPVGHRDEAGNLEPDQLGEEVVLQFLKPYLQSEHLLKVGHNIKYDFTVLFTSGIELKGKIADTLIAAYLNESGGRSLKLDDLCLAKGFKLTPFSEVVGGDKREDCFSYVSIEDATDYSCEDVYGTLMLWQEFEAEMDKKGVVDLFWNVEMKVLPILAHMEMAGICVDSNVLQRLKIEFGEKLQGLEKNIHDLAGREFNINSPQQLGTILFEELGLPHGRKTKTGFSTDVKVLEKLARKHDLPARVLAYRTTAKLLSTYVDKLSQLKDDRTGRIHTSFNQAVTATGRLSSSEPNLQNIPIRTEEGRSIREAFVPQENKIFLSADYSQIDLRVLAHYSGDRALINAFRSGEDIHARTAAEIFGVSSLLVNDEMRRVAKSINFGIVYGMSAFGLSNQLDISRKDAQRFIDRYFNLYTGVQDFMRDIVARAKEEGRVTTLLGRTRTVADIHSKNRVQREFAERMAINTPIQGTAADIIKLAMIECQKAIDENGFSAKMLLQIHDELVFELPEDEVEQMRPVVARAMENVIDLEVPLVVNFELGHSLAK
ncbi:DNA polymerase I [Desulforhopalus singaporensis]|uniref:DNA polymerase I n=1 Tax=Desulforhopalus singaporensis TaxID=91360 RepID=A0A1H0R7I2_9BACT|nr:DNA polymerase I [Desulforhopalus singaporensis]SDP25451.1 DNA polymerase I [Desulforhopalus singaporensis]